MSPFLTSGGWQEDYCVLESLCRFKVRANVKDSRLIVESLRLLRTNYSVKSFYYSITNFKTRLQARGYQHNLIEKITSEIKFTERKSALQQNEKVRNKILPFFKLTTRRCLINLKNILKPTTGSRNIERASHLSHTKKENF